MHTHDWQTNPNTGLAECSCSMQAVGVTMSAKEAACALARFIAILAEATPS